jgi:hypothetical protein
MVTYFIVPMSPDRREQFYTLWEQLIACGVFVQGRDKMVSVELINKPYNLGMARNIGAMESGALGEDVLCFHDVAIVPTTWMTYPLPTRSGVVGRIYCTGHPNTLGAITAMTARDYRKVYGWVGKFGWGEEDVAMYIQCKRKGLTIDKTRTSERFGVGFSETDPKTGEIQDREAGRRKWLHSVIHHKIPTMRQVIVLGSVEKGHMSKRYHVLEKVQLTKDLCWIKARV